jgi:hypothetical protein
MKAKIKISALRLPAVLYFLSAQQINYLLFSAVTSMDSLAYPWFSIAFLVVVL